MVKISGNYERKVEETSKILIFSLKFTLEHSKFSHLGYSYHYQVSDF